MSQTYCMQRGNGGQRARLKLVRHDRTLLTCTGAPTFSRFPTSCFGGCLPLGSTEGSRDKGGGQVLIGCKSAKRKQNDFVGCSTEEKSSFSMTESHVHLTGVKTLLGQTYPFKMIPTPLWCFGWLRAWLWFCSLVLRSSPLLCLSCAIKHLASTITQQRIHTNVQPCICTSKPQRFPQKSQSTDSSRGVAWRVERSESEAGGGVQRVLAARFGWSD